MMVGRSNQLLDTGAYRIAEAARLLETHHAKVRRWLREGSHLVHRTFDPAEQIISFRELMELYFIKMFRDEGVSLQAIRKASQAASQRFATDYPFAVKRFDTDGRTIFATLVKHEGDDELVEDLRRGQYVFTKIVRPFFKKLDYDNVDIARFWPQNKSGRVVLDPKRQFGRPIDHETGVPTRTLYAAVCAGRGQSDKQVASWFNVPIAAVRKAVEFEKSLR